MTNCTSKSLNFSALNGKKIVGSFSGGTITSDGGLLLVRGKFKSETQHIFLKS